MIAAGVSHNEPAAKRRKVRKGTRNCWECKRRKVRCIFESTSDTSCVNCTQRHSACISQEYDENTAQSEKTDEGMEARLRKMEEALERLAGARTASISNTPIDFSGLGGVTERTSDVSNCYPLSPQETNTTFALSPATSDTSLLNNYTGLSRELVSAWPEPDDYNRICELPICLSTHSHMMLCTPSAALEAQPSESTLQMLQLPPPGSHPALIARKLLLLTSLLQGAVSCPRALDSTRSRFTKIMSHVFDTATRLVTNNNSLVTSMEGIECIMIEAMILNYAGKLHQSWLTTHRAAAVAQLVGLHRGYKNTSLKILDSNTRADLDPDHLCFRIVEMDSYLSITLGLPLSSLSTPALTPQAIAKCQPIDRVSRLPCIISGHLLSFNGGVLDTDEIDRLLLEVASAMPPQWWLAPTFQAESSGSSDTFYEVSRLTYQVSYYHLVLRRHLPYILRHSTGSEYDNNKLAAAAASREALLRYISFRLWNAGNFYCRGMDYLAFVAIVVLCLVHIVSRSAFDAPAILGVSTRKVLESSHHSDRGLMERTLGILAGMEGDSIAMKLSQIMKHMLDVELDAASGAHYSALSGSSEHTAAEFDGTFVNNSATLQLQIPYFGTINLQRGVAVPSNGPLSTLPSSLGTDTGLVPDLEIGSEIPPPWTPESLDLFGTNKDPDSYGNFFDLNSQDDWTLQTINETLFSSLFGGFDDQSMQ
ncbi:hypothetical protein BKA63DRAFT_114543 [Paraphoma chrysanthemicola]|nr:hypothetical protein BKA63DRAFT_114543 [Paraphoma chrysanthemicola]